MSVPIIVDDDRLILTMQIETEVNHSGPSQATGGGNVSDTRSVVSPTSKGKRVTKSSNQGNKTKMSFKDSNTVRGKQTGWKSSDMIVARIISMLGHCRFDIFVNAGLAFKKHKTQKEVIQFVHKFTSFKTVKEILRSVKNDVPKLLGFKAANIYLSEPESQSLLALSVDEEAEKLAVAADPQGFEREFNFDQRQIVKFPNNMGLSGFAHTNDGIAYLNGFDRLQEKKHTELVGYCHSIAKHIFPAFA